MLLFESKSMILW